jgi:hypothetical protein
MPTKLGIIVPDRLGKYIGFTDQNTDQEGYYFSHGWLGAWG